nr:hypothetical protein [uncultured Flavobacterium sp.]
MKKKLTKIIIPFILISIGFLVTYSLFYWFVFIFLKLADLNDSIFGYYVPIGISATLILFYFRKKLHLLDTTSNHREFTLIVSWILLTAPVVTFQFYLVRELGELTHVKTVDEILTNKPTMYYSIDNSFQHKNKSGLYVEKGLIMRGIDIGVECYFACPLTNSDDSIYKNDIWIGTMLGDKFTKRQDGKEKKLISQFIDASVAIYDKYKYRTKFLKRLSNSNERDDYLKAIEQTNLPFDAEKIIILREETGNYQSKAGTSLRWTGFFLLISNVVWILLTIFKRLKHN